MTREKRISQALEAAEAARFLDTAAQVEAAAGAWEHGRVLGMDTEFVRERTFHANLGLVQVSDGCTVWLIDPLPEGTLAPVATLLGSPGTTKVLHSPSEDLEVLQHVTGALPDPMFDTQVACALLGQPLQVGYHKAIEWLFGIQLDKDQTRSDWCARPLSRAQLHYAALDVCLLPLAEEELRSRLESAGRLDWLREDCGRQLDKARQATSPQDLWQRIKGTGRLDGQALAILQRLAIWREERALRANRPRGFIISDPVMIALADRKPARTGDLQGIDGLHAGTIKRHGESLSAMIEETMDSGASLEPAASMTGAERKILGRLRAELQATAARLSLDPAVLATRKELEDLVLGRHDQKVPERLLGWRARIITDRLLAELAR